MSEHQAACTGTKLCRKCGETKPALAFAAKHDAADGMHAYCRDCVSKYHVRRRIKAHRRPNGFLIAALEG